MAQIKNYIPKFSESNLMNKVSKISPYHQTGLLTL